METRVVLQKAREALEWALETLDDTDAYLHKVDSQNYEKFLNLATDRVAKAKARQALKLLSEHATKSSLGSELPEADITFRETRYQRSSTSDGSGLPKAEEE